MFFGQRIEYRRFTNTTLMTDSVGLTVQNTAVFHFFDVSMKLASALQFCWTADELRTIYANKVYVKDRF